MKTPAMLVRDVERRLSGRWNTHLAGEESVFPHAYPLGRPTKTEMLSSYSVIHAQTVLWQDWARTNNIVLEYENREAQGKTVQPVPTHARIDSIDAAATIAGGQWPDRLSRGRERIRVLRARFPHADDVGRLVRLVDGYSAVDFDVLLTVADWYLEDPRRASLGITPRQVPIPGVHAKWLQTHRTGVQLLTGIADLGLLPAHASRIHFTYLDPGHRGAGGRVHDSATVGDNFTPAYLPEIVLISENKDTAIHFPMLARGISVEGVGKGGKTVAEFPWIREAPLVVYWGDIDRDGFEILNGYRSDFDRNIESILMDLATYKLYERFGTNLDKNGKAIPAGEPRPVNRLRTEENELYLRLVDSQHVGHRRIEQERIPLERAIDAVTRVIARVPPPAR